MYRAVAITFLLLLCGIAPVSGGFTLFIPGSDSISSVGVNDIIDGKGDMVLFATDNGRSVYYSNSTWQIYHVNWQDKKSGPLGDYVTALEYDSKGNLWIGYTNGLQIHDGEEYVTIADQQLLKNLNINDLQRRGNEMWIATGHAGLHRYVNDEWTWYKPFGPSHLNSFEITGMGIDYTSSVLFLATENDGIWMYDGTAEEDAFIELAMDEPAVEGMTGVRSDPFGGVYLFNATQVVQYETGQVCRFVLGTDALGRGTVCINDLAPSLDGTVFLATDNGIFGWKEGRITMHLDRTDGIGSYQVRKVMYDNSGRLWFVTAATVGYVSATGDSSVICIEGPSHVPGDILPNMSGGVNSSVSTTSEIHPGRSPVTLETLINSILEIIDSFLASMGQGA